LLVIGPVRAVDLLDVIVHITGTGDEVILHAKLWAVYRKLLDQSQRAPTHQVSKAKRRRPPLFIMERRRAVQDVRA
jgi:hypothetical protein